MSERIPGPAAPPETSIPPAGQPSLGQAADASADALRHQVEDLLREVVDPELGINIVDLGLVYDVAVEDGTVRVAVTMTTPACPLHAYVLDAIESVLRRELPQVRRVDVRLVWDPPWHPDRMSREAKRLLGWEA